MVQKQTKRRSSLILGVLLALLLGVAAGFFVLAMPVRMLETVTTVSRLSKLMVQAEPPISPNDRTLLAVLAGILATGIGWVLVDWLVFGRAGMRTLIRTRDDDYEDEDDGDAFRPTDPLDLVSPVSLDSGDWSQTPSGDARRPLSARTDIGDPPGPAIPFGGLATSARGTDQALPPINQILPGLGSVTPPPLLPFAPPPLFPQAPAGEMAPPLPQAQPVPDLRGPPVAGIAGGESPPSWPPLDIAAPAAPPQRPSPESGWLPSPGRRPDPEEDGEQPTAESILPAPAPAPSHSEPIALSAPLIQPPQLLTPASPSFAPSAEPVLPPPPAPVFSLPEPVATPAPPPVPAFDPAPISAPVIPRAALPSVPAPANPSSTVAGIDRARLEDLLVRLEQGLQKRRAAATHTLPAPAPAPAPTTPVAPPAAYAAGLPIAPPPEPSYDSPAAGHEPPAPVIQPSQTPPPSQAPEARKEDILDQPLHVTLDLLRNMVKR